MESELTKEAFIKAYESGGESDLKPYRKKATEQLINILKRYRIFKPQKFMLDSAVNMGMSEAYNTIDIYNPEKSIISFIVLPSVKFFMREVRPELKFDPYPFYLEEDKTLESVSYNRKKDNGDEGDLLSDDPHICMVKKEKEDFISDTMQKVLRCINQLEPAKRRAMQAFLRKGLTDEDLKKLEELKKQPHCRNEVIRFLAEELGISEDYARQILKRAKEETRDWMRMDFGLNPFRFHENITSAFKVQKEEITDEDIEKLSLEEILLVLSEIL